VVYAPPKELWQCRGREVWSKIGSRLRDLMTAFVEPEMKCETKPRSTPNCEPSRGKSRPCPHLKRRLRGGPMICAGHLLLAEQRPLACLTAKEAQRLLAANIAKLPELLQRGYRSLTNASVSGEVGLTLAK
jgi:hypothetical protein